MSQFKMDGKDGGLAWCVALACCFINFVTAGIGRMSGILYVAFIDMFGISRGLATAPFSIRSSTRNLLGPVVGILGQHYGVRKVTVIGSVVGLLSSASCFFATDINWIIIIWGGINGIGVACTSTLPQVVISQYFDKHLTTAAGLAISGGCIGSFLFPALIEFLLHNYGLQGTFLLMTGITMHVLPAAMMLRKPPWIKSNRKQPKVNLINEKPIALANKDIEKKISKNENSITSINVSVLNSRENIKTENSGQPTPKYNHLLDNRSIFPELLFEAMKFICSNPKYLSNNANRYQIKEYNVTEKELIFAFLNKIYRLVFKRSSFDKRESFDGDIEKIRKMELPSDFENLVHETVQEFYNDAVIEEFIIHLQKMNSEFLKSHTPTKILTVIFELVEVHKMYKNSRQRASDSSIITIDKKLDSQKITYDNDSKLEKQKDCSSVPQQGFARHIKTAVRLNSNPIFNLICFCRALHFVTFNPVVTAVVDFGMDKGLPEEYGKYIIAALSAGDLMGRLCMGWITDRGYIDLPRYMAFTMVIQGAVTVSLPYMCNSWSVLCMICIFGLLEGSIYVRHPVLISKYIKSDHQPIAMGCLNFLTGLIGFGLPAYVGYFRDTLGSYDQMFYLTGALGACAGLAWILEPQFVRCSSYRKEDAKVPIK